ncbi:hypothetical protein Pmani_001589 [Petrolisthes manimaculis]|uniref:Uncharacterized protein n=1 Tax=Petrolisthes manimaculis TaxID=1843537 RepID=A0AAE1QJR0_9EUCA|nr:hypothetical protein Pmani_001589 [Petrolisthes manimaculis]
MWKAIVTTITATPPRRASPEPPTDREDGPPGSPAPLPAKSAGRGVSGGRGGSGGSSRSAKHNTNGSQESLASPRISRRKLHDTTNSIKEAQDVTHGSPTISTRKLQEGREISTSNRKTPDKHSPRNSIKSHVQDSDPKIPRKIYNNTDTSLRSKRTVGKSDCVVGMKSNTMHHRGLGVRSVTALVLKPAGSHGGAASLIKPRSIPLDRLSKLTTSTRGNVNKPGISNRGGSGSSGGVLDINRVSSVTNRVITGGSSGSRLSSNNTRTPQPPRLTRHNTSVSLQPTSRNLPCPSPRTAPRGSTASDESYPIARTPRKTQTKKPETLGREKLSDVRIGSSRMGKTVARRASVSGSRPHELSTSMKSKLSHEKRNSSEAVKSSSGSHNLPSNIPRRSITTLGPNTLVPRPSGTRVSSQLITRTPTMKGKDVKVPTREGKSVMSHKLQHQVNSGSRCDIGEHNVNRRPPQNAKKRESEAVEVSTVNTNTSRISVRRESKLILPKIVLNRSNSNMSSSTSRRLQVESPTPPVTIMGRSRPKGNNNKP